MSRFLLSVLVLISIASLCCSSTANNIRAGRSLAASQAPSGTLWNFDINSYYVNEKSVWLFNGPSYPMEIRMSNANISDSVLNFEFKAIDTFSIQLTVNSDGSCHTTNFEKISSGKGSTFELESQKRILSILSSASNFRVGHLRNSFIVYRDNERVSFFKDGISNDSMLRAVGAAVETRYIVPATYFHNGRFKQLFSGPPFTIKVDLFFLDDSRVLVTLVGINDFIYEISYQKADGWVTNIKPLNKQSSLGTKDEISAETKIRNIVANTQQIAFEKNGRVQFITDSGSSRISFDPSNSFPILNDVLYVIPTSYFFENQFETLFDGDEFPISLQYEKRFGTSLIVELTAVNTLKYEIVYNSSDGLVKSIKLLEEIPGNGSPDQLSTEAKIRNIIAATERIAFYDDDGSIVFNSNGEGTKITFGYEETIVDSDSESVESVDSDNESVESVESVDSDVPIYTDDDDQHPIVGNGIGGKQSITDDEDDESQILSGSGVSNASVPSVQFPNEVRYLAADSYFANGKYEPLFSGPRYSMILYTRQDRDKNSLMVTLRAVNAIRYELSYDSDGWVNHVTLFYERKLPGITGDLEAEDKVKNIIANCQQISFEKDGHIQFITNEGSTRVSFVLA